MIRRVVTIGGPPGSGKSTAGRAVAGALGLEYRSAGELFRAEAAARGLTLEAFGHRAEADPGIDRALDERMQGLAAPGRLLDGRIQGALCRRAGTPVHAIVVTAGEAVRIERIAARDRQSVAQARAAVLDREASERRRYLALYGLDLDRTPSDLTVDSSSRDAAAVARAIVDFLRGREAAA